MSIHDNKEVYYELKKIISDDIFEMQPIPTNTEAFYPAIKDFKAIIFDIYGTLFISGSGDISIAMGKTKSEIFNKVFSFFNIDILRDDKDLSYTFNETLKKHTEQRKAQGIQHPEIDILSVWNDFIGYLKSNKIIENKTFTSEMIKKIAVKYEFSVNPVYPMPGAKDFIEILIKEKKQLGIISNAQFYTPLLFYCFWGVFPTEMGFNEELCIYSYKELEAKPSKRLFDKITEKLKKYGIEAKEALYIGNDIKNDIYPAQEAGLKTALFAGDKRSLRLRSDDKEYSKVKPDYIITSFKNIGELR